MNPQETATGKDREKRALPFIGAAFFALAAYVLVQSIQTLALHTL